MNAHEAARTEVRAKGEESAAAPVESAVMPEVKDTLDHLSSDLDKTLQQLVTMTTDAFAKLPRKD